MLVISIGIVYLWFGALKLFPGVSPAEGLAKETLSRLSFGIAPTNITYFLLAFWEVSVGLLLILNVRHKIIIYLGMAHMIGTFTPLFLLPDVSFNQQVYILTLVGQYIIKNLVIFTAFLYLLAEKKPVVTRVIS